MKKATATSHGKKRFAAGEAADENVKATEEPDSFMFSGFGMVPCYRHAQHSKLGISPGMFLPGDWSGLPAYNQSTVTNSA
jgi:hypothetical protein